MGNPKELEIDRPIKSQFILDGGKDKLVQQQKFIDQGDLIPIRSFFIFFDLISTNGLIFAVHKSSMPYLGNIIGELIKIRFPVNGQDDVEWMARIVASQERNSGYWWDKGFDESNSSEVLLHVKFEEMPEERIKTIQKVLRSKYRQIKSEKRKLSMEYFANNLLRTGWRMLLYFCFIYSIGTIVWSSFGEKADQFFGGLHRMQKHVKTKKEIQYSYAENLGGGPAATINGVELKRFMGQLKKQHGINTEKNVQSLNKEELLKLKTALEANIHKHRAALQALDESTNAPSPPAQLQRSTSSEQ